MIVRSLLASLALVICQAWASDLQSSPAAVPLAGTVTAATSELARQVTALQEQNRELQEQNKALQVHSRLLADFQSSILETVYWALGFVGGAVAIVVGASWLVNFKLYESDKQRLQESFDARTDKARIELIGYVDTAVSGALREAQERIDNHATRVSNESIATRTELVNATAALSTRVDSVVEELNALPALELKLAGMIHGVEATARGIEAEFWDAQGIPANVLLTEAEGLDAAVSSGVDWQIRHFLRRMLSTCEGLQKEKTPLSQIVRTSSIDALDRAKDRFPVEVQKVRSIIAKLPIKAESET